MAGSVGTRGENHPESHSALVAGADWAINRVTMSAKRFIFTVGLQAVTVALPVSAAFSEAPELRRQVEAGTLPHLEERLPVAPVVITPVEKPGEYGGTWRIALVGYDSHTMLSRTLAYEHLVRWDANWTRVEQLEAFFAAKRVK